MFRRVALALPAEPLQAAAAAPLVRVDDEGMITITNNALDMTGDVYEYHISDSERVNERNREDIRKQIREILFDKLASVGLRQLFLAGKDHSQHKESHKPSINIVTTELSKLQSVNDVMIIVGEHDKDLGISDWVDVTRSRGLNGATAAGLVNMLPGTSFNHSPSPPSSTSTPVVEGSGLIILNPGQLLWSHVEQTNLSLESWMSRRKPDNVEQASYEIDPVHNRVPGHANPEEHVNTFLDHILPQLTKPSARVHFIAVGDGGDSLIKWLDNRLKINADDPITEQISAMALIEPSLRDGDLQSSYMRNFCHNSCKVYSWVLSEEPKATLLGLPHTLSFREYVADPINEDYHEKQVQAENPVFTKYNKYSITAGLKAVLATKMAFNLDVTDKLDEHYSDVLCGTFSGGEPSYVSKILPQMLPGILRWFDNIITTDQKIRDFVDSEHPALPKGI